MCDIRAQVTKIQKFCTHDGPGIRTTVFFKGCPLRCQWCHNPETRSTARRIMYSDKLCVGCGTCGQVCTRNVHALGETHDISAEKCVGCGACVEACPTGAVEMDSMPMHVSDILSEVLRDRAFYGEKGGLTISGGEPMFQPEACISLLKAAKAAGISTALETCGHFGTDRIKELAGCTDVFLWDVKDTVSERHRQYTGQPNTLILHNLRELDKRDVKIFLRCIMVNGVNMDETHADGLARLFASLSHCEAVELLPYHAYGASKAAQTWNDVEPHREWIPSEEKLAWFGNLLISKGVKLHTR